MKHLEKDYKQQKPNGGVQVNTGSGNEYILILLLLILWYQELFPKKINR